MKKTILSLLAAVALTFAAGAQNVSVSSAVGQDIGYFLEQNFVGDGAYIFNVQFNGLTGVVPTDMPQIGTFQSNGYTHLGMDSGLVLTTGNIAVVPGPNRSQGMCYPVSNQYIDPIIGDYVETYGYPIAGCGTIDFDFVSLTNHFSFSYCFGSEEYNEFVFTEYNDAFVCLLSGPDPETGAQFTRNISIVPGTIDEDNPDGIPVSINTVNAGYGGTGAMPASLMKPGYYMFDQYYYDNDDQDSVNLNYGVQFDGLTNKLSASATILPCTKYHMHISVCNVSNGMYDSGVFLESHSFSGPSAAIGLVQHSVDTIYSNSTHDINLSLANTDYDQGVLHVNFGGEAHYGVDYVCVTDEGNVINSGETVDLDNGVRTLTITPLAGGDFSYAKRLDISLGLSLCPEYPELLTKDTMTFFLKRAAVVDDNPDDPHTGIDAVAGPQLTVYPNPASESLTVSTPAALQHISIIDAAGREVYSAAVAAGLTTATVDVATLEAGIYTVRTLTAAGQAATRVVIK